MEATAPPSAPASERTGVAGLALAAARTAPTALLFAIAAELALRTHGSIAAVDWLGWELLAALVLAAVAAGGAVRQPSRVAVAALLLLLASAFWAGLSSTWSSLPTLGRDEGLLTLFYAIAAATPLLTVDGGRIRRELLWAPTVLSAGLAVATAVRIELVDDPSTMFGDGRLGFPITYANAQAVLFALGVWPAILLAGRRTAPLALRGVAVAAACVSLAAVVMPQSKGTVLGLLLSLAVVLAVSPARLRLLVPWAIAIAGAAAAFLPLTAPFRVQFAGQAARVAAAHETGRALLAIAVGGLVAGTVYAWADRRVELSPERRVLAGRGVLAVFCVALVAGAAVFLLTVGSPAKAVERAWTSFTHKAGRETGPAHLTTLGSNRYDFWRVAVGEFKRNPIVGDGARAFGPAYLQHGRSYETPARAHSLPLEVLAEQGAVGAALLGGALAGLFALCARGARRRRGSATAALGGGAIWFGASCVDWTWTFPAVTAAAFALLGLGASGDGVAPGRRAGRGLALVCVAAGLLAIAPPWLSARIDERALATRNGSALTWARRLDPVSTQPLLAEAQLAASPAAAVGPLRAAVRKEPDSVAVRYYLGTVELAAGQRSAARADLRVALRLKPGDPLIEAALRQAG